MKTYITYGKGNKFDKDKLPKVEDLKIELSCLNKVRKTLWGSPVDANYGWKEWCEDNGFHTELLTDDNSFKWTLKPEARILYIEDLGDLEKVPFITKNEYAFMETYIDFESIIKSYDAMEICMDEHYIGHMFVSKEEIAFNSWDCDSIMVFNREMIIPL